MAKVLIFFLYLYCFLAFLPQIAPVTTGLDPSWKYAISRAAVDQLIFGQDIVFTYGPLGHLIHGSPLEENFWQIFFN